MSKAKKQSKDDKGQSSIFDFGDLTEEEKLTFQNSIVYENHTVDSKIFDEKEPEDNLRSEQIIISKKNYPSMSSDNPKQLSESINNISKCCHFSKNLYNQCLFEIRQAFFGKIDSNDEKEKDLRIKIRSALNKFKNINQLSTKVDHRFNYKNTIYKLLDKYFKDQSKIDRKNDNYSWSAQAAQQTIDLAVEAWYDLDLAREDYGKHPDKNYTGKPGSVIIEEVMNIYQYLQINNVILRQSTFLI